MAMRSREPDLQSPGGRGLKQPDSLASFKGEGPADSGEHGKEDAFTGGSGTSLSGHTCHSPAPAPPGALGLASDGTPWELTGYT